MANEITLTAALQHSRNGSTTQGSTSLPVTQSGTKKISSTQIIGTTSEAISFVDVTPAYVYLKNTDATNFVYIGYQTACTSANAFLKLLPGEAFSGHVAQSVMYALADTAPVNLEVFAVEA